MAVQSEPIISDDFKHSEPFAEKSAGEEIVCIVLANERATWAMGAHRHE